MSEDFDKSESNLRDGLLAEVKREQWIQVKEQIFDAEVRPIIKKAILLDKEFALLTRGQMIKLSLITQKTVEENLMYGGTYGATWVVTSELLMMFENFMNAEGFQLKYLAASYDYSSGTEHIPKKEYSSIYRRYGKELREDDSECLYLDGGYNSVSRQEWDKGKGKVFSPIWISDDRYDGRVFCEVRDADGCDIYYRGNGSKNPLLYDDFIMKISW